MAEHANERIRIDASLDQCLSVVLDFESYPSWARDLKQVTIQERDDDGRGRLVEFRAAAMGQSFKYVLEYDYSEMPDSFSWVLNSGEKIRQLAPRAQDMTSRRARYKQIVDEFERRKNRTKARVRSKVEHVFRVMKRQFGFDRVRYRGLAKNANRLFACFALVNLYLTRKRLAPLGA